MKKRYLTISSALVLTAPALSLVSCNQEQQLESPIDFKNPAKEKAPGISQTLAEQLNIEEDGLYLLASDYHGTLWNGETIDAGQASAETLLKIPQHRGWSLDPSIMFGDQDAFYMFYDQDDQDELSSTNFDTTFMFSDTSVAPSLINLNVDQFHFIKHGFGGSVPLVPASDSTGALSSYAGSQNNHLGINGGVDSDEFQTRIRAFVNFYGQDSQITQSLLSYYGLQLSPDAQGHYLLDPSQRGASVAFAPVVQIEPFLTYEKIDQYSIKFTWHVTTIAVTAAELTLKINDQYQNFGSLSIGDENEWNAYVAHPEAKYIAIKNQYLNH